MAATAQVTTDYYQTYWTEEGFNPTRALPRAVQRALEQLAHPGTACLDVGCGDGRTEGIWLDRRTRSYIGVDVSRTAVESARTLGLDARVIEDASVLPFDSDTFDLVVCLEVLEHLMWPQDAAAEILRVLRPGGALLATVPNAIFWQRRLELLCGIWNPLGDDRSIAEPWRDPHVRFFTAPTLRSMLRSAGFRSVEIGGHDGVPWIHDDAFRSPVANGLRRVRGLRLIMPAYIRAQARWPASLSVRLHATAVK
jgi:SAM-dependent methyltransferase